VALLGELEAREERDNGTLLFRGLRVGMGLADGDVETRRDPSTGSVDSVGAPVRHAARLRSVARGGQVLITPALALARAGACLLVRSARRRELPKPFTSLAAFARA
jgi:class 3 adenylate cyclase